MAKVTLKGYILISDYDLESVQSELSAHIRLTRDEPGCLVFEVTRDPENPNRYNVYEEFIDKASFELHQQRVRSSVWGEVTKNVERNYEICE